MVIAAEQRSSEWVVSVRYNGVGTDSRFHDCMFGLFKRLDREKAGRRHDIRVRKEGGFGTLFRGTDQTDSEI